MKTENLFIFRNVNYSECHDPIGHVNSFNFPYFIHCGDQCTLYLRSWSSVEIHALPASGSFSPQAYCLPIAAVGQ